ncbi:MAG: maleylpyruvate isomerase family mycothiol-dependent enzyme [Jatrophihabitantaceae bacterium]
MTNRLEDLRSSNAALLSGLAGERWSDADVHAPSLLPDWSRGHVLTHLARNADAVARTVSGALRGERVPRYPNGQDGRNADIEAGAGRAPAELLADVTESGERLDRVFAEAVDADGWARDCDDRTVGDYVLARWREVEIHRIDLGGSYRADAWPAAFVSHLLPDLAAGLAERASTPLRIEVGLPSTTELGGTVWTCGDGDGDPVAVVGPD